MQIQSSSPGGGRSLGARPLHRSRHVRPQRVGAAAHFATVRSRALGYPQGCQPRHRRCLPGRSASWRTSSGPKGGDPDQSRILDAVRLRFDVGAADRGSVLPLLAMVLAGFGLAIVLIGVTARHEVRSAKAQWAADAAALAAAAVGVADGGDAAAVTVAEANGARVVSVSVFDATAVKKDRSSESRSERNLFASAGAGRWPVVVVRVDYGGLRASAAAQRVTARNP